MAEVWVTDGTMATMTVYMQEIHSYNGYIRLHIH